MDIVWRKNDFKHKGSFENKYVLVARILIFKVRVATVFTSRISRNCKIIMNYPGGNPIKEI